MGDLDLRRRWVLDAPLEVFLIQPCQLSLGQLSLGFAPPVSRQGRAVALGASASETLTAPSALSASTRSFLKAVCSVSSSQSFPPASMVGGGCSDQPPSGVRGESVAAEDAQQRTVLSSAAGRNTRPPGADMLALSGLSVALALALVPGPAAALKEGECEVCLTFLGKFYQSLNDNDVKFNSADIEKAIVKTCKDAKGKENRFCYYIGATADAATKMINEVSKPLSHHVPVEKICEKLKKKDSQICELKYDKQLDLTTVDLKKLKVKDLKKILEEWGESCKGCAEKSDFIRKITELMPKYAPAAAKARTEL